jgi:hypothetical protein
MRRAIEVTPILRVEGIPYQTSAQAATAVEGAETDVLSCSGTPNQST